MLKNLDKVLFSNCFRNKLFDKKFGIFASQDEIPIGRYNKMGLLSMEYIFKIKERYMENYNIKFKVLTGNKNAQVLEISNGSKSVIISNDRFVQAKKSMPQQMTDQEAFYCYYFYQTINEKVIGDNVIDIKQQYQEVVKELNFKLKSDEE